MTSAKESNQVKAKQKYIYKRSAMFKALKVSSEVLVINYINRN